MREAAADYLWPRGSMLNEQLVIVLRPESRLSEALKQELAVRNWRLPDFKRIHGFVLWEQDFPRTTSLKIKRNQR